MGNIGLNIIFLLLNIIIFKENFSLQTSMFRGGGPGRLWEETCIPKVVSSNPSTIYWMDIFHISRIVIFV